MVPLIYRHDYFDEIKVNPKLKSFLDLTTAQHVVRPTGNLREVDETYYALQEALSQNSKADFDGAYSKISKRKISADSLAPFIHDDALIFTLLLGITRYNISRAWINEVLDARTPSDITATFKSISRQDYFNRSNLPQIILPFVKLLDGQTLSEDYINESYRRLTSQNEVQKERSDFLKILSINAFDAIILSKSTEGGEYDKLKKFEKVFLVRVSWIASTFYYVILAAAIWGLHKVLIMVPWLNEWTTFITMIFGVCGITVPLFTKLRGKLRLIFEKLLGHDNETIYHR
jgi:hypothetical protein